MSVRRPMVWVAMAMAVACGDDLPDAIADASTSAASSTTAVGPTEASGASDSSAGEPACGPETATELALCIDVDALVEDVGFVADLRLPGTSHWLAVQELCADRLTMLGFEVEMHDYGGGINVLGRLPGTESPGEVVLLGAHYDHISDCLGADDNATGVAGVLEAARVLATAPSRPRTLAVACWDQEELGLIGSSAWVAEGQREGETVIAYLNYDMIGYASDEPDTQGIPFGFDAIFPAQYGRVRDNQFRGDFILMVADDLALAPAEAYELHAEGVGLSVIATVLDAGSKNSELFSDLRRSDHAPFWREDIPAIFLTDTGEFRNEAYHCRMGEDTVDRLDFEFSRRVVAATVGSAAETLGLPR